MATWKCQICKKSKVAAKKPSGLCTKRPRAFNRLKPHVWYKEKN